MVKIVEKRDGSNQSYDINKIKNAITKVFQSTMKQVKEDVIDDIVTYVDKQLQSEECMSVEAIQDIVEKSLMQMGYYVQAKAYILYRHERFLKRSIKQQLCSDLKDPSLQKTLNMIETDFKEEGYALDHLYRKYQQLVKKEQDSQEKMDTLIKAAIESITIDTPKYEMIGAYLLNHQHKKAVTSQMLQYGIQDFASKVQLLSSKGLYGSYILENYTMDQLREAASFIDEDRDKLLNYSGMELLFKRYVICDHQHQPLETIQEMFLGIALHLAMKEKHERMFWVRSFYDMLSKLEVTMATPTLSNARKPYYQLSSCFVDTIDDSLDGIFRSITNFSQVSKFGGGMGMYLGKVRALGSSIRGFDNAAGGVIRWIKIINDTAVAVDQLGVRNGAVAVYLDIWHKDILDFLNLKTNNGDERLKAHDIFPGVCYPDYFWRLCEESLDQSWYLFDPHEVNKIMGFALEDSYGQEWEKRYQACINEPRLSKKEVLLKDLVRMIIKSAVETGTPFVFNRDIVNKYNPNKHAGMIYCSNLCTEIAQNMQAIQHLSQEIIEVDGESIVVEQNIAKDFVVCNLASLSLGNINVDDREHFAKIIHHVIRALDNVIDLNYYPLPYAKITNQKYRSIGLGVSGYHHLLAKKQIPWESEQHLDFVDELFEFINYEAIKASNQLAQEKGSYALFKGSDWESGAYFSLRNYTDEKWQKLQAKVAQGGMRNAYLMAIAPTGSTSIIANTTAGIDPIMNKFFLEEKKGSMLARVAPSLNKETYWYYKQAHHIDQNYSIKAAGIRSRHIDQAQSMNLYITNEHTMRQLLNFYILANKCEVKTLYYVRSRSLEVEECESCSA
ncbi:MAG: ribonucleoside-diphosphate reductase subunit alpha [Erysipelotrichaceae bacterium]|nr:ribonucleoside-diphosphate reductase subunit alpha [Erysipelotrichaceae bacterium]MDY5252176.1 ribonucleoside-diphosphate reductase subunit alpha [Erysipelotrichaceae bacterium]